MNRKLSAFLLLLFTGALLFGADVQSLPKPTGYVSDLAHVVNPQDRDTLESFCTKVDQQLGVQFALVTIDTVGDRPIRDFALDLSRLWGVGDKKSNQGVLLLLAVQDRQSDIETGRGVEPYITDGFSGGTLRAMRPSLRAGDYGAALLYAAREMAGQIARGKNIEFTEAIPQLRQRQPEQNDNGGHIPFPLIVIGLLFLLFILSRGGRGRGGGGGFLTGILLGNLLGGGTRRGRWGGDGWGGGGFGGGSGGGGGFGGFGGGDFGGGGASSNW